LFPPSKEVLKNPACSLWIARPGRGILCLEQIVGTKEQNLTGNDAAFSGVAAYSELLDGD
jgi:hypothetical protein